MGFFSKLFGKPQPREPRPYTREELLSLHGSTLVTAEELYRAFSNDALAHDDQMVFLPRNDDNPYLHKRYEVASWAIHGNDGSHVPHIHVYPRGEGPICYGEFMDALRRKGEEYGWDSLYYIAFDYYAAGPDKTTIPYSSVIEQCGDGDPRCFIVRSGENHWRDYGGFSARGIGGAAGI